MESFAREAAKIIRFNWWYRGRSEQSRSASESAVIMSCRSRSTHSKDADENIRLKYRYLDLRNPEVKSKIVLRSKIVADLRQSMTAHDFMGNHYPRSWPVLHRREREIIWCPEIILKILCTSAGTAAVQTASDGFWIWPLFPDRPGVSVMRMPELTVLRESSTSWIWRWLSQARWCTGALKMLPPIFSKIRHLQWGFQAAI